MSNFMVHHNTTCIECEKLEKQMIIVGAFVLCCNCAADIFPSGEYEPRSDEYQKLLKKYQENL